MQALPGAARPPRPATAGTTGVPQLAPLLAQVRAQPRIALILGGAGIAAALAAVLLWARAPDYKVLFANVADQDGGAIVTSLQQMNVPYKLAAGAILVPADQAAETRLRLAAQGLPKAAGVGFELLDNQKFGTSQFAEQVNYQRGLEGELARSIESIGAVQSARVHLALPRQTLFVRDQKKPSASVLLMLHPGRSVDDAQVSAIVHLVSSSVADLDDRSVTVVDQHGNLLSAAGAGTRGLDVTQLKYVESVEQSYVRRIENILQPIVGAGNVRAQVAADIDFSVVEGTEERYRPNQEPGTSTVRSQQTSESTQPAGPAASGVPGALSNQAPAAATAPLGAASALALTPSSSLASVPSTHARREVTTNYEVDRTIKHTQQGAGATRRLSVAVVVNQREVRAANGKTSLAPLSAAELEQITNLVKEAVGFNAARGDSVNVVNSPFTTDAAVEPPLPAWKDPHMIELAKTGAQYLLAALALLLVFLGLRARKPAPGSEPAPQPVLADETGEPLRPIAPGVVADAEAAAASAAVDRLQAQREADIEFARQTAGQDPQLVASLVRHWLAT